MKRVILTGPAVRDIKNIAAWLEIDSPEAAERFYTSVIVATAPLAEFPRLGRSRDEIRPGLRSLVRGRYVILYREVGNHVVVVGVIAGERDLTLIDFDFQ